MDEPTLKPCPSCGAKQGARSGRDGGLHAGPRLTWGWHGTCDCCRQYRAEVYCHGCGWRGARSGGTRQHYDDPRLAAEAVESWNTRAGEEVQNG